jgi:biotin--protein ligase
MRASFSTVTINPFPMTTHPSVLFLCSPRLGAVTRVLKALSGSLDTREAFEFKANNDTFCFHPPKDAASVLKLAPSDVKHVIAYAGEELPGADMTTLFNLEQYFRYLAEARKHTKVNDDDSWGFGEVILYGEIVTSAQSMLDK